MTQCGFVRSDGIINAIIIEVSKDVFPLLHLWALVRDSLASQTTWEHIGVEEPPPVSVDHNVTQSM